MLLDWDYLHVKLHCLSTGRKPNVHMKTELTNLYRKLAN
jgi:hypothetical protein